MSRPPSDARGFTLIELMIVMAIIAILMAIAIPSYRRYIVRANRTDAQRALMDLAARQERYYYSNNAYGADLDALGAKKTLAGANYEVSVASASSTAFVVQADALGSQKTSDTQCQSLTMNNLGVQGSKGSSANLPACWSK